MKVLLCSCNTLIMFIFGWVIVTCFLWASMYDNTFAVLFNIYICACDTSCRVIVTILYPLVPLPAGDWSSQVSGRPTNLNGAMYCEQNSIHSSTTYLSTIEASGRCWFLVKPFNTFMYCLNGYIHCKTTEPHNRISLTRWTTKCTIMSKKIEENTSPFDKGQWKPHFPIHPIF